MCGRCGIIIIEREVKIMNALTTEQHRELDKWYTQYSLVNKRRPTWNELCKKAEEIMKKGVDN